MKVGVGPHHPNLLTMTEIEIVICMKGRRKYSIVCVFLFFLIFHAKCSDKILGVPHPYTSKISNEDVMRNATCQNVISQL
jgi:hypothetical protein